MENGTELYFLSCVPAALDATKNPSPDLAHIVI